MPGISDDQQCPCGMNQPPNHGAMVGALVESTVMGINFVVKVSDLHVHILGNSYDQGFGIHKNFCLPQKTKNNHKNKSEISVQHRLFWMRSAPKFLSMNKFHLGVRNHLLAWLYCLVFSAYSWHISEPCLRSSQRGLLSNGQLITCWLTQLVSLTVTVS